MNDLTKEALKHSKIQKLIKTHFELKWAFSWQNLQNCFGRNKNTKLSLWDWTMRGRRRFYINCNYIHSNRMIQLYQWCCHLIVNWLLELFMKFKRLLNEVVATNPTIGSNVEEFTYKNIRFLMWDLGGQESLRATWTTYYVSTRVIECFI